MSDDSGITAFAIATSIVSGILLAAGWWPAAMPYFAPTRLRAIANASPGPAMVTGIVEAGEATVRAPLGDRECLAYEVVVAAFRKSGNSHNWVVCERLRAGTRLVLRDPTSRATLPVELGHGQFDLERCEGETRIVSSRGSTASPLGAVIKRHAQYDGESFRISEVRLETGMQITIDGEITQSFGDPREHVLQGGPGGFARVGAGDHRAIRAAVVRKQRSFRVWTTLMAVGIPAGLYALARLMYR